MEAKRRRRIPKSTTHWATIPIVLNSLQISVSFSKLTIPTIPTTTILTTTSPKNGTACSKNSSITKKNMGHCAFLPMNNVWPPKMMISLHCNVGWRDRYWRFGIVKRRRSRKKKSPIQSVVYERLGLILRNGVPSLGRRGRQLRRLRNARRGKLAPTIHHHWYHRYRQFVVPLFSYFALSYLLVGLS